MAWFRVHLTEEQPRIVPEERVAHPNLRVREKMLVIWLLHCGATREHAALVVGGPGPPSTVRGRGPRGGLGRSAPGPGLSPGQRDGRLSGSDP